MIRQPPAEPTRTEHQQHAERQLIAAMTMVFAIGMVLLAATGDFIPLHAAAVFTLLALILVVTFQGLVRSGATRRLTDPDLVVPQMVAAALVTSYGAYEGGAVRPLFILIYLIAFTFGVFTLDARRLMAMAVFYLACYAGVVALSLAWRPDAVDGYREAYRLMFLAIAYAWFVGMGVVITRLRTRLRQASAELAHALGKSEQQARLDSLTGCLNHRSLMDILEVECSRAQRGSELSVFFADLDNFKAINDSHGHLAGDEILRQFAEAIRGMLRATDHLGRYGGEEFMVILAHTALDDAVRLAERIRQSIEALRIEPLPAGKGITVSIGVARYRPPEAASITIARADAAMYEAKRQGRNRVVRADEP